MQVNPYLTFDGRCEAAFKFYERTLGAKIQVLMTAEGTPMANQCPPEWVGKIMHGRLSLGDQVLMASDTTPDRYEAAKNFSICLSIAEEGEAERVFQALSEGGAVQMPIQETFWAVRFGMVTDQFGIPWMVNCERPRPA